MNPELKLKLLKAIRRTLDANSDNNYWEFYIHEGVEEQMTEAAALVFDSAMDAQKYSDEQSR